MDQKMVQFGPFGPIWSNLVQMVLFHLVQWKMDHFLHLPCKWRKIQAKRLNTIKGRKERTKGELSKSLHVCVCVCVRNRMFVLIH